MHLHQKAFNAYDTFQDKRDITILLQHLYNAKAMGESGEEDVSQMMNSKYTSEEMKEFCKTLIGE